MTSTSAGHDNPAGRPIASVVIPAHNEAAVIGRLLDGLQDGGDDGTIEVVVACNGCTDDTAAIARAHGARVVEVAEASKVAALNAGDGEATCFPRVYADADLVITGHTIERLVRALAEPGALVASPPLTVATDGRPWAVRSFYAIWQELPYIRDRHVGGVIALSAEGRRRFDRWPDVIADDRFARLLFGRDERRVVGTDPVVVEAPYTLAALVRRRSRVHAGNRQVADHPALAGATGRDEASAPWWQVVVAQPFLAPAALAYVGVNVGARLAARRQAGGDGDLTTVDWARDETTRGTATGGTATGGTATGGAATRPVTAPGDSPPGGPRPPAPDAAASPAGRP